MYACMYVCIHWLLSLSKETNSINTVHSWKKIDNILSESHKLWLHFRSHQMTENPTKSYRYFMIGVSAKLDPLIADTKKMFILENCIQKFDPSITCAGFDHQRFKKKTQHGAPWRTCSYWQMEIRAQQSISVSSTCKQQATSVLILKHKIDQAFSRI